MFLNLITNSHLQLHHLYLQNTKLLSLKITITIVFHTLARMIIKSTNMYHLERYHQASTPPFLKYLQTYSWEFILEEQDTQTAFDLFYECCYDFLNAFYTEKYVKIKSADPSYMTPQIKFLLLEKNKLMRKGEMSAAANVACRIGKLISANNSKSFKSGSMHLDRVSTIKDLWSRVRQITKKGSAEPNTTVVSAEQLNAHYANTSSDPNYENPITQVNCF